MSPKDGGYSRKILSISNFFNEYMDLDTGSILLTEEND